jgi:hypothetical protein
MRRTTVLVTCLLAALAPVPARADLLPDGCHAYAALPEAPHSFYTEARGGFACDQPTADLSVTVCLEVLDGAGWTAISCGDGYDPGPATFVKASATGCWWGIFLYRSTAVGRAGDGRTGRASSLPVLYFCTPL